MEEETHQQLASLEAWLNEPVPDVLWHYTSVAGFQGIIQTDEMWATDVRFTNDRKEFTHALDLVDQLLEDALKEQGPNRTHLKTFVKLARAIVREGPTSLRKVRLYVISFSKQRDALSQWRAYSGGSAGVSLGFGLKELRRSAGTNNLITFARCIYNGDLKRQLLGKLVHDFLEQAILCLNLEQVRKWIKQTESADSIDIEPYFQSAEERVTECSAAFATQLLQLAAICKDDAFKEEDEWRLVLPFLEPRPSLLQSSFRPKNNSLVPYISFDLFAGEGKPLPVSQVVLGPGSEPGIAREAAEEFLRGKHYEVELCQSAAPFRNW